MDICRNAIKNVYTRTCYRSECKVYPVNDTGDFSERIITDESQFNEDRKYSSTLQINHYGGVNLQSNAVEISNGGSIAFTASNSCLNSIPQVHLMYRVLQFSLPTMGEYVYLSIMFLGMKHPLSASSC